MASEIVLFGEEDNLFRLMETAIKGTPSPQAERALRYFFGEDIVEPLARLTAVPGWLGLPEDMEAVVCEDPARLADYIADADYLVVETAQVTRELLERPKGRLRLVQKFGRDYRNIDTAAARELGIPVANLTRISTISVAEHVILLVLALARNLTHAHTAARARGTSADGSRSEGPPTTLFNWGRVPDILVVWGKTLGLIGLGENGLEVARRARCLGMNICYHQRRQLSEETEAEVDATYMPSLVELMQVSDFVSAHVPYNASTEKLIGAEALEAMKGDAYFINASRGGIVDEQALYAALKEGRIAGAGLDVYRWEPVPADCPLLKLDNVVWTTHNAGGSPYFMIEESRAVLENVARVREGRPPEGRVA